MVRFNDKDFLDDNFFVIDSNNCSDVCGKLYGYVITENEFVRNKKEYNKIIANTEYGTYVNVVRIKNKIIIQQDYWGSYGLFVYRDSDYFAVSNSFLYLVNHIFKQKNLSLDIDYLKYFICDELASLSFERTAINEIKQVRKNSYIYIYTDTKQLKEVSAEQKESVYSVDSKECFEILDKWHNKFANLFRYLIETNQDISVSLSGGMDSRASFTVLGDYLDRLDNVRIFSLEDFKEDFEIVGLLAEKYHFKVNAELGTDKIKFTPNMAVLVSLLTKMCFHKQFYINPDYPLKPLFSFGGSGGEALRNHWKKYEKTFVRDRILYGCGINKSVGDSVKKVLEESFDAVRQYCRRDVMSNFYKHTRLRSHFGKTMSEAILKNNIAISPLMDPSLCQIDLRYFEDPNLLFSIIYQRYLPGIIDIKFDSNRKIEKETIEKGNALQKKYPRINLTKTDYTFLYDQPVFPSVSKASLEMPDYYLDFYYNSQVKNSIDKVFSEPQIYLRAALHMQQNTRFSYADASTLIAVAILDKICTDRQFDIFNCLGALADN